MLHCVRLNPRAREQKAKSRFLGLVFYRTLAHYFDGCAFWQPLRSNTQPLGLSTVAALDF